MDKFKNWLISATKTRWFLQLISGAILVISCLIVSDWAKTKTFAYLLIVAIAYTKLAKHGISDIISDSKIMKAFDMDKDGKLGTIELFCITAIICMLLYCVATLLSNAMPMVGSPNSLGILP